MRIIISPAKKMKVDTDNLPFQDLPVFLPETEILKEWIRSLTQDTHQIIVIGVAAIVPNNAFADSLMDEISSFVEFNTEAEITDEEREIR